MDARTVFERRDALQIVDVREPEEWRAGHIEGARHIPMDDVADRLEEIDRRHPVVTVCRSGSRSGEIAEFLRGRGFDAQNMEAGMEEWDRQGLPLTTPDGAPGQVA
ncbi:rhodanese-like domain-containing protein [soil metagenome]